MELGIEEQRCPTSGKSPHASATPERVKCWDESRITYDKLRNFAEHNHLAQRKA
jgi:hypothetical protein